MQGTMTISKMLCQKRSFPLGRMMCQKISGRAVPKVSSLHWLSLNLPLKWKCNKCTLVQFGYVDLGMLGGSVQLTELKIMMPAEITGQSKEVSI